VSVTAETDLAELDFAGEREAYFAECDVHYATYPTDVTALEAELEAWGQAHPEASPCAIKARLYEVIAERCPVKLFRTSPFYHEIVGGRARNLWGFDGLGGWLVRRNHPTLIQPLREQVQLWQEQSYLWTGLFDLDHQTAGYERLLEVGLRGIIRAAEERLASADAEQGDFLRAVIAGQEALLRLAERMGEEAARLAAAETDPWIRARLELIAATAPRVPAEPPQTFYEALAALLFYREACTSMEGLGISILGHLDRLLAPYYEADLAAGRITYARAKDLMARFLSYTDARWDFHPEGWHEVSTCITLGGCDAAGAPLGNEVTRLVLESYLEFPLVNPKLNARVTAGSPDWYLELLGRIMLSGRNVLATFNDDVIIPAQVAEGKAVADARLYVSGGCQELVLSGRECSDRAGGGLWLRTMPKLLLLALGGVTGVPLVERQEELLADLGLSFTGAEGADFESLYGAFRTTVRTLLERLATVAAEGARLASVANPCPLVSGAIYDCVARAEDFYAGGARYNGLTVSYASVGTLYDALFAVRRAVYEEQRLTLAELAGALGADFAGAAELESYLRALPKYGHGRAEPDALAERVAQDLLAAAANLPQGRGGRTEPAFFTYWCFADAGRATGATPDGRRAGQYLSQGCGASRLRAVESPTDAIRSLESLHLDRCSGGAILDVTLPLTLAAGSSPAWAAGLIRGFQAHRGSILQVSVLDPGLLREAQADPASHPGLQVRVAGYTALFTSLRRDVQDEIIDRASAAGA
jgi:formate C-acetyltransferase